MDLAKPEIQNKQKQTKTNKNKQKQTKTNKQKQTNILTFSSMVFITNSLAALYKKYYIYSLFFFLLTLTSLSYHTNYTPYTKIIDRIALSLVVFYGGYMLYNKYCTEGCNRLLAGVIILFFLSNVYLYMYGYCIGNYCFHPELCVANNYHSLMHILASIGHHFIIFL